MTETAHLGLPFIDGGQAQKHVTHNEALKILDAAIQIAVLDRTRTVPPPGPADGQRHVVAAAASGFWAGHDNAVATWQDGAWTFLEPHAGWCVWSVADDGLLAFDGAMWRALGTASLDSVAHLGINASADASNLLSVRSSAALFAAIDAAAGGSGDVRLQLSRESAARTASVVFSNAYSGRAEFGLVGSDAFKLKVSADGSAWVEAFAIDQASGNLALPRGLALTGVIAPATITADQNDYAPAGLAVAAVLQISSNAARSMSGLGGGAEGRVVSVINVGSQPITLLDEGAGSLAGNRFALGGGLALGARQAALLRYDGTAARWQAIAGPAGAVSYAAAQALTSAQQNQARANAGVPGANLARNGDFRINQRGYASGATLAPGAFGHDGFKAGSGGGDYAFTQLRSSTQITIAAGKTLIQVLPEDDIAGGSYVLSWTGTGQARVGLNNAAPSGAYAASPIVITGQTAAAKLSFEFGNGAASGTLGTIKLEPGSLATPFVMQPLDVEQHRADRFCQKYVSPPGAGLGNGAALIFYWSFPLRAKMYAAPNVTLSSASLPFSSAAASYTMTGVDANQCTDSNFVIRATTSTTVASGFVVSVASSEYVLLTAEP
jgi:hypothetical protein